MSYFDLGNMYFFGYAGMSVLAGTILLIVKLQSINGNLEDVNISWKPITFSFTGAALMLIGALLRVTVFEPYFG